MLKIISTQKMTQLLSLDLIDNFSIEQNYFSPNYSSCNIINVIKEVMYVLNDLAIEKRVKMDLVTTELDHQRFKVDSNRF